MLPLSRGRRRRTLEGLVLAVELMSPKNPFYSELIARTIDMAPSTKEPGRAFPPVPREENWKYLVYSFADLSKANVEGI